MRLKVRKLAEDAKTPHRNKSRDAGYDIFSYESHIIRPFQTIKVRTGVALQLDETSKFMGSETYSIDLYCIRLVERSSVGSRGIGLRAGLLDESYNGEVFICLTNHNDYEVEILKGDKIAQFIVQKVETPYILEVDQLDETERNGNGFGSTGR